MSLRAADSESPAPPGLLLWSLDIFDREVLHFLHGIRPGSRHGVEGRWREWKNNLFFQGGL
jgi:hypothetical protein